jgi:putative transcriptional regulator
MEDQALSWLKGQFLIAMPGLADPNFHQTVTCISEHTTAGAVGIVINRVHESLTAKAIFQELKMEHGPAMESIPVHIGGPVHSNEIFILHGPPSSWDGSLVITPSLAMSNTRDILSAIAMGKGPAQFILSLGCAGWGPGQLEFEIKENAWLTGPADAEVMFHTPVGERWAEAVKRMGIDPMLLSENSGHA